MAKVLIVDDEKDIAELISDALADEGFETVIKTNGLDAINVATDNFDLIILDIMMPGLSGTEVCNKIREKVDYQNDIRIGEIRINLESYEAYKNDSLVELSTREFELLSYLMKNAGIVLS